MLCYPLSATQASGPDSHFIHSERVLLASLYTLAAVTSLLAGRSFLVTTQFGKEHTWSRETCVEVLPCSVLTRWSVGVSAQGARRGLMTLTAQVKWHCLPPSPAIALYLPTLVHLLSSYHFLMFTFTWEFVQCPLL